MKLLDATDSKTKQTLSKIAVKSQLTSYMHSAMENWFKREKKSVILIITFSYLPPGLIQVQLSNDEKQKSNNKTMNQVHQLQ